RVAPAELFACQLEGGGERRAAPPDNGNLDGFSLPFHESLAWGDPNAKIPPPATTTLPDHLPAVGSPPSACVSAVVSVRRKSAGQAAIPDDDLAITKDSVAQHGRRRDHVVRVDKDAIVIFETHASDTRDGSD